MSKTNIEVAYDAAEEFEPKAPRPLRREVSPSEPYPVGALGEVLGPAAEAINDKVQAPLAICAQSVLGAATLAVQGFADVVLPTGSARPISQYLVTVAESGERKTTVDEIALRPVRRREDALTKVHDIDLITYLAAKDAWLSQRRQICSSKATYKSVEEKKEAMLALGPPPDPPLDPMLTCPEPTYEGLVKLLAEGQPSVGIFSSEGGRLIGGHAMSDDHKIKTAAGLSEIWDGQPIKRVRQGEGSTTLYGRRVSLHLMVQPGVASRLIMDPILHDQGLLSRVLTVYPTSASGTRMWHDSKPESAASLDKYDARILEIMGTPLPLKAGKANELKPRRLPLSTAARSAWIELANGVEKHIGSGGELDVIRAFANKMPEHAARLAAVIALVDDLDCVEVSVGHMEAGIVLTAYYSDEARRLAELGGTDPDLALAEKLLTWLHTAWNKDSIPLTDIYQSGPNKIRYKEIASRIVAILVDHGWLIPVEGGAKIDGTHHREVWHVVKKTAV